MEVLTNISAFIQLCVSQRCYFLVIFKSGFYRRRSDTNVRVAIHYLHVPIDTIELGTYICNQFIKVFPSWRLAEWFKKKSTF